MDQFRIGRDLYFAWPIETAGMDKPLDEADITMIMITPMGEEIIWPHTVEGNVLRFEFSGCMQRHLGTYRCEIWLNKCSRNASVIDKPCAFRLVGTSQEERISGNMPGERMIINTENFFVGITDGNGGGGQSGDNFTPSQLRAINSGIDKDKVADIAQTKAKAAENGEKLAELSEESKVTKDGTVNGITVNREDDEIELVIKTEGGTSFSTTIKKATDTKAGVMTSEMVGRLSSLEETSETTLAKADEALDEAGKAAQKADDAAESATNAEDSAAKAEQHAKNVDDALKEIAESGDIPAATVAQVVKNTADIAGQGAKLSKLEAVKDCIAPVENDYFAVADKDGNIAFKVDEDGLDFSKITDHAIKVLNEHGVGGLFYDINESKEYNI